VRRSIPVRPKPVLINDRNAPFKDHITEVAQQLATWKEERLPPPRVNQSQYDKVGLTRECFPTAHRAALTGDGRAQSFAGCGSRASVARRRCCSPFCSRCCESAALAAFVAGPWNLMQRDGTRSPEFLRMTELSDNPELQTHSQAVLSIISAVTPPDEFIDPIVAIFVDAVKSSKVRTPI
jgi:proteasome activator subunit 4